MPHLLRNIDLPVGTSCSRDAKLPRGHVAPAAYARDPSTEQGLGAMSKFSLSKASGAKETKRAAEAAASGASPFKIPKVSEITIEAGPKPSQTPRRRPQVAPVQAANETVTIN